MGNILLIINIEWDILHMHFQCSKLLYAHMGFVLVDIHEHEDQTFLLTLCLQNTNKNN